ncbi:BadF/BadG/BcrA/BcrD ATPase family protein [Sporolactobacillus sp. Y61]|uniref:BadF/BadG/BcrA/BcrD ATPase family protein n=1 Tax=Sporolactobacillus sp. Y61 TaxID=3160863 RepID=A0AAU8IET0_9BACL
MKKIYLAIDGGGTKTDAVLFSNSGKILSRAIGAGTNPNGMSFDQVTDHFRKLFSILFDGQRVIRLQGCFAGLSGADHPALTQRLTRSIQAACPADITHLQVGNDAMNALWSGTDGKPGMVVIAGTGSIAYGLHEDGRSFRIGGWGFLFGDEGSGYDIGRETIRQVLMEYDGRRPATALTSQVKDYFQVTAIPDIIPIVYQARKDKIAGLVPLVAESAELGDSCARKILDKAADQLIQLIGNGLEHFDTPPQVVLTGGVWKCILIRQRVLQQMNRSFVFPVCPPVWGSMARCLNEWEQSNDQISELLKKQL